MTITNRPLKGSIIGLSISGGENSASFGFPESEINRTVLRIVAALVGQGAGVSFGHDWRDDGIMQAIHGYVQTFQPVPFQEELKPLLWNFVPWKDVPNLSLADKERFRYTLKIEEAGLPVALRNVKKNFPYSYLRARGLTHLRHKLIKISDARICLGGKNQKHEGRYPGIVEEALLAIKASQPIYFSGCLGGVTQEVIAALKKENKPNDLCPNKQVMTIYRKHSFQNGTNKNDADLECSAEYAWNSFVNLGVKGLSNNNHLSVNENYKLFKTTLVDEAIKLMLTGLGRFFKASSNKGD